ncbi:MOSC domain-containing protein [Muricoccus aerilatus]|uniref:MOSC domain-containing protein n=1 Tax=Muricoccus aerilatus TaxID=452982 RepID=UPI000693C204|nr:MOSC domain-containing protein [Roseomonas aerilata]
MTGEANEGELVGAVAALIRFPTKSMAGECRTELELRWPGIHGDRQYSFCRAADRSRFPWLSARDLSRLVLYRPLYHRPDDPRHSPVEVTTPSGERLALDSLILAEMLSNEAQAAVGLMQVGSGIFDAMPVSLASTASLAAVDEAHGTALDARRFRLNIVVESSQRDNDWCSAILSFGEVDDGARVLVNNAIPRCALITIDPDTAERDATVMRTVAQKGIGKLFERKGRSVA